MAEVQEPFVCKPLDLLLPEATIMNYGSKTECVDLDIRKEFENYNVAGPSTKGEDLDETIISSELNSDQERTIYELRNVLDDSDQDYVPDSSSSETSDEEDVTDNHVPLTTNFQKKRTRWNKSDPFQWKKNLAKRQKVEAKAPQNIDCSKCRFKCTEKISLEKRMIICKNYWSCDFNRRKDFVLNNVISKVPERRRAKRTSMKKPREDSKSFFFYHNDTTVRVCKSFFIKTLAFRILGGGKLFSGNDKREKKEPHNKTKSEDYEKVKAHIESFPVMESHYTRKSTKRQYLDSKLTIAKMHFLYKQFCEKDDLVPISLITYRRIFCKNYNYSFYKPKKDQCQICMQYKSGKDKKKKELENIIYQTHVLRKEDCNAAKIKDKERALHDNTFLAPCLDVSADSERFIYVFLSSQIYEILSVH
ncbi:uncharacterized protein LOC126750046 [Anthonomus grandis grandis]|uniref:uncharacterized protein LOC126750046 n=1 Tax=Anthonomus grandis grandis TaxID=2921223 RepID=UPI00216548F8|nr:uncharacterized protein LOC126750046 [Anthonomus grandis grandis]